jgi:2-alkenal reductase
MLILSVLACQLSPDFQFNVPEGMPGFSTSEPVPTIPGAPVPVLPDNPGLQITVNPGDFIQPTLAPTPELPQQAGGIANQQELLVTLFERVNPGVVLIQVLGDQSSGLGSGFVVDKEGNIVTNYHVVEGATSVEVDFPSGFKALGEVIATDLDSDIAVIHVDAPAEQLVPLPLGDANQLQVGMTVVAIGNPYGLSSTMTTGIVSAKGRTLESMRQTQDGTSFTAGSIIQTDAPINPGNSGGPLLNLNGEVIGINRAIRTAGTTDTGEPVNTGIGFAISINIVKRVLPTLIRGETYDYPYLGLSSIEDLSLVARKALGLNRMNGAYVTAIVPGGPADDAGLRAGTRQTDVSGLASGGDLIIAADGQTVNVFGDLLSYMLENKSPGDELRLTIVRGNEEQEVTVTLGKRP